MFVYDFFAASCTIIGVAIFNVEVGTVLSYGVAGYIVGAFLGFLALLSALGGNVRQVEVNGA